MNVYAYAARGGAEGAGPGLTEVAGGGDEELAAAVGADAVAAGAVCGHGLLGDGADLKIRSATVGPSLLTTFRCQNSRCFARIESTAAERLARSGPRHGNRPRASRRRP